MSALIALDLDQTVVFSKRSAGEAGPSTVVEHLDGEPLSSMTDGAVEAYRALGVSAGRHAAAMMVATPETPAAEVSANGGDDPVLRIPIRGYRVEISHRQPAARS